MATSQLILYPQDLLSREYWEYARSEIVKLFDRVASDQVYGIVNICNVKKMRTYKQLFLYLNIMLEERTMDIARTGIDLGDDYYKELYCIKSIKKALVCRGIKQNIVDMYFNVENIYVIPPPPPPIVETGHATIKTGSKLLIAESETPVYYRGLPFADMDYTLSVWAYTETGNRVELEPIVQTVSYFIVKPLETLTIRYIAAKQES